MVLSCQQVWLLCLEQMWYYTNIVIKIIESKFFWPLEKSKLHEIYLLPLNGIQEGGALQHFTSSAVSKFSIFKQNFIGVILKNW